MKGHNSQPTIENPFIKSQNKSWELTAPDSLNRSISPPPRPRAGVQKPANSTTITAVKSVAAAVEAGDIEIDDHVSFFSTKLWAAQLPMLVNQPRLAHQAWLDLYRRNLHDRGHHFVVHQHDHPIAGTHYDLRLQCNASSSISFAIMYGLPGDPNSRRLNRNATETRVHNLWNHLIETASSDTGTMLLWDTGEYSVIPYEAKHSSRSNSSTDSSGSASESAGDKGESEPEKLHRAFQARKIKLRLHGTKLPPNYTISLRLTADNFRSAQPAPPAFKRRRRNHNSSASARKRQAETTDSSHATSSPEESHVKQEPDQQLSPRSPQSKHRVSSLRRLASPPARKRSAIGAALVNDHDESKRKDSPTMTTQPRVCTSTPNPKTTPAQPQAENEEEGIRFRNAYPGATNSINSIHQRKWFLSLDRAASGLTRIKDPETGQQIWRCCPPHHRQNRERGDPKSDPDPDSASAWAFGSRKFQKFHVLGRDHETSVVTGRRAADVARDEGLIGYRPRAGWRGITE